MSHRRCSLLPAVLAMALVAPALLAGNARAAEVGSGQIGPPRHP